MTETEIEQQIALTLRRPYHRVITGEPEEGYLGERFELPGCNGRRNSR